MVNKSTLREYYIKKVLGLSFDPFVSPVSELELKQFVRSKSDFESYLSPFDNISTPDGSSVDAVSSLKKSEHALVFGDYGSGKTALRLTLEMKCRREFDRTLVVTYELGDTLSEPLSIQQHCQRLARAIAIALFIQIVENLHVLVETPTPQQRAALARQYQLVYQQLRIIIRRMQEEPSPNQLEGIGSYWSLVGRPSVKYIPTSPELDALLTDLSRVNEQIVSPDAYANLRDAMDTAWTWGFDKMLILVDGIDTRQRSQEMMIHLLVPLMERLNDWTSNVVFMKFFLPSALENPLIIWLEKEYLTPQIKNYTISWTLDSLRELLEQRFQAANSRYVSLNELASDGLDFYLEEWVLDASQKLPRRLIEIVNVLIDVHIERLPSEVKFTFADWFAVNKTLSLKLPSFP